MLDQARISNNHRKWLPWGRYLFQYLTILYLSVSDGGTCLVQRTLESCFLNVPHFRGNQTDRQSIEQRKVHFLRLAWHIVQHVQDQAPQVGGHKHKTPLWERRTQLGKQIIFLLPSQFAFRLMIFIKMISNPSFGAAGHKNYFGNTSFGRFFNHILNQRLVYHREHLLGSALVAGKKCVSSSATGKLLYE